MNGVPRRLDERVANEFGTDGRGNNGLNAEFTVHLAARRIVDAADDALDLEHALRNERRHDVAIVAVCDCDKTIGAPGARALEDVVVDARSDHDVSLKKSRTEPLKSGRVFVDVTMTS